MFRLRLYRTQSGDKPVGPLPISVSSCRTATSSLKSLSPVLVFLGGRVSLLGLRDPEASVGWRIAEALSSSTSHSSSAQARDARAAWRCSRRSAGIGEHARLPRLVSFRPQRVDWSAIAKFKRLDVVHQKRGRNAANCLQRSNSRSVSERVQIPLRRSAFRLPAAFPRVGPSQRHFTLRRELTPVRPRDDHARGPACDVPDLSSGESIADPAVDVPDRSVGAAGCDAP